MTKRMGYLAAMGTARLIKRDGCKSTNGVPCLLYDTWLYDSMAIQLRVCLGVFG